MEALIERFGEAQLLMFTGALIGFVFGAAAYKSRFCLRAACVEVAEGRIGAKLAIWLVAFLTALLAVQGAQLAGVLDVSTARPLAATGSLSGALIGGAMFGAGMVLARGCASRLLVLSASGNLRAIITGLVLTLVAQASLRGALAPARESLAGLWTVSGTSERSLQGLIGLPSSVIVALSAAALIGAILLGLRSRSAPVELIGAAIVGLMIYAGWQMTHQIAANSFEIVALQSVTFTGPSTDTLMAFVNERSQAASFGLGLVPGVFLGAFLTAALAGEARIQRFEPETPMERYLVGGCLMGFGSMLAGGCAVGAGVTGGSILAVTAWAAIFAMWAGAVVTHLALKHVAQAHQPA